MAKQKGYKYPRLTILLVIIIATFFTFSFEDQVLSSIFINLGLLGAVIAGFFYAFSFTAFASTGIFLELGNSGNILTLGLIAGLGTLLGDILILKLAKISFEEEFKRLYKEPFFKSITKPIPKPLQHFFKVIIAMIFIASPLPDEAGVALLANGYRLPRPVFAVISYTLNTSGILLILYTGKVL